MAMTHEQFTAWMENQQRHQAELLRTLSATKKKTLVDCTARFGGNKDSVESFLAALRLFKELERLTDAEVIKGLPLLLTSDASEWWEGVKESVTTFDDFEDKIRQKYAPKQPTYLLYNEIYGTKQKVDEATENFIAKKRMLFSLLPAPKHHETQQIDMVYMLLRLGIRDKIPRNTITTFDQLIECARGVETVLEEQSTSTKPLPTEKETTRPNPKIKCGFCKNLGHSAEVCRKRIKAEKADDTKEPEQAPPSTPAPRVSCYGCGAPGVVRTKCPNCAGKTASTVKHENVSFCALNVKACVKSRPVLFIEVGGINGYAYVDTGAKANIASYALYQKLVQQGYTFKTERINLSLADGVSKFQTVLVVKVEVKLVDRTIPTTFLVLPESRNNKTLLGIGFLQAAGMILDLAQFTWRFYDKGDVHELFSEDFAKFEEQPSNRGKRNASPVSIASMTSFPDSIAGAVPDSEETASYPKMIRTGSKTSEPEGAASSSKSKPIASKAPEPEATATKTPDSDYLLFDGYSPRLEYMYRDARMTFQQQKARLSPWDQVLFPDVWSRNDDVDIHFLDITLIPNETLNADHQSQSETLLPKLEGLFPPKGEPVRDIGTGTKGPVAVPSYRLSSPRKENWQLDAINALEAALEQGEGSEEHPVKHSATQSLQRRDRPRKQLSEKKRSRGRGRSRKNQPNFSPASSPSSEPEGEIVTPQTKTRTIRTMLLQYIIRWRWQ